VWCLANVEVSSLKAEVCVKKNTAYNYNRKQGDINKQQNYKVSEKSHA